MGSNQIIKTKTVSAHVLGGKPNFKRSMISSYLAWTLPNTSNQIWEKQWVGRRTEETWRVLEQLEYSWERGHVHRERLKQAISGPAPLSPHSHTIMHHPHPSLSTLIHLSPPQQGPVVHLPSRHGLMSYTDGWEMWGGWESQTEPSQRGLQRKMAASVVVPWFL